MKKAGKLNTLDRIVKLLKGRKKGLTAKEIAFKLSANPHTVRKLLGRPSDVNLVVLRDTRPCKYEYDPLF